MPRETALDEHFGGVVLLVVLQRLRSVPDVRGGEAAVSHAEQVREAQAANMEHFVENGPGLSTGYSTFIIARAPGKVLVGGLGGMGCGTMWVDEQVSHREAPTYAEAPWAPDQLDGFLDRYDKYGAP